MLERVRKVIGEYDKLREDLLKLIGYNTYDDSPIDVYDDIHFEIKDGVLYVETIISDDEIEVGAFTINSYSSEGEKYYFNIGKDITVVMVYDEDEGWSNYKLFVFETKNKMDNIDDIFEE